MSALAAKSFPGMDVQGPHPTLVPLSDDAALTRLDRPLTLAGAGGRCRLQLRSATASRMHAMFVRDGAIAYVRDLASREGVKVAGEFVRESVLTPGDVVELGTFGFVLEGLGGGHYPPRAPSASVVGIEIEGRTMLIGRRETCDLVVDHEDVAPAHAVIVEIAGARYLRDLSSPTGVLLNGQPAHFERLADGDVIGIGPAELAYAETSVAEVAAFPVLAETGKLSEEEAERLWRELETGHRIVLEGERAGAVRLDTPVEGGTGGSLGEEWQLGSMLSLTASPDVTGQEAWKTLSGEIEAAGGVEALGLGGGRVAGEPAPESPAPLPLEDTRKSEVGGAALVPGPKLRGKGDTDSFDVLMDSLNVAGDGGTRATGEITPGVTKSPSAPVGPTGVSSVTIDLDGSASGTVVKYGGEASVSAVSGPISVPAREVGSSHTGAGVPRVLEQRLLRLQRGDASGVLHMPEVEQVRHPTALEVDLDPEMSGRRPFGLSSLGRWAAVLLVSGAAAFAGWEWTKPNPRVSGFFVVRGMEDPRPLLSSPAVRREAVRILAEKSPGVEAGFLANEQLVRRWTETASLAGPGAVVLLIPGTQEEIPRVEALVQAAVERATPIDAGPARRLRTLEDAVRGWEDAARTALADLNKLEEGAKNQIMLNRLIADAADSVRQQVLAESRLETARKAQAGVDVNARQQLDDAVRAFERQLREIRQAPGAQTTLAPFVQLAEQMQGQGLRLTQEIMDRRAQEAQRLLQLRKRLEERNAARQQQIFDADVELQRLTSQRDLAIRRQQLADPSDDIRKQDLLGEVQYLDGLVSARKLLISTDRGEQRVMNELQEIINEQANGTEKDRLLLERSFSDMRKSLSQSLPDASGMTEQQKRLAADLETRLEQLQSARTAFATSASMALVRQQGEIDQLIGEVRAAGRRTDERKATVAKFKESLPTQQQIQEARERFSRLNAERQLALRAVEAERGKAENQPLPAPEIRYLPDDGGNPWLVSGGLGLTTLLLLGLLTRLK
jgi:pSer/pThr/pTyr-binding forkhead associated (FHA) protein